MRVRLPSKLIAALLAPALLASGATHGLSFLRCGSAVRISCCCPKEPLAASANRVTPGSQHCCNEIAAPSAPAQAITSATPVLSAPMFIARLGPSTSFRPVVEQVLQVPSRWPPPPPSPSLILANCTLLI